MEVIRINQQIILKVPFSHYLSTDDRILQSGTFGDLQRKRAPPPPLSLFSNKCFGP